MDLNALTPPVVLAPMAGVTNIAFRRLCRRFGAGLYVNEMVTARGLVERNPKTLAMLGFDDDGSTRSAQLYGVDPTTVAEAVRILVDERAVDHVDLNFGCPVAKVTRKGGGAALPAHPRLLAHIVRAAVKAADAESGGRVPVTVKCRMGITAGTLTHLSTGRIAEVEGAAAIALHARTAELHYSGRADWAAIGELKAAVATIPVFGNGDVWSAADGVRMIAQTGCDGVVVGRGCLGNPWLFRDLAAVFAGGASGAPPRLDEVASVLAEHARLLVEWAGERNGMCQLRKHTGWYLTGYAIGGALRARFSQVSTRAELDDLLARLDAATPAPAPGLPRGTTSGPRSVQLPPGWLDTTDDASVPCGAELDISGG